MLDFLKRLFGRGAPPPQRSTPEPDLGERLVQIQRAYWQPDPDEKAKLVARFDALGPAERLRLHHLNCLDLVARARLEVPEDDLDFAPPPEGPELDLCRRLLPLLFGAGARYRPRHAEIWQRGHGAEADSDRAPSLSGELTNASVTHVGALEVIRLEGTTPTALEFIAFDQLRAVDLGAPRLFRPARVYLEGEADPERFIPAMIPLLYGPSWDSTEEHDKDGSMTRFSCHVDNVLGDGGLGAGIGHQDFTLTNKGMLFGLGSIESIAFPLDMREPDFDERCRGRGIDPDEIRRRVERKES